MPISSNLPSNTCADISNRPRGSSYKTRMLVTFLNQVIKENASSSNLPSNARAERSKKFFLQIKMLLVMFLNQIIREKKCHSLQMLVLKGPPKSHFSYKKETKKECYILKSKIKNKK